MENKFKAKLKRKGKEVYQKYFFNSNEVIDYINKQLDKGELINENICEVIFNIPNEYNMQMYELISYYPNLLKEIKHITPEVINKIYNEFGETISIMKEAKSDKTKINVRGKIAMSAAQRAKHSNIEYNLTSEDIKLVRICPFLNIPLEYGNTSVSNYSASIDRIDSTKGYIKGNIQIISNLGNSMKSSASPEQLVKFSKNILKIYEK